MTYYHMVNLSFHFLRDMHFIGNDDNFCKGWFLGITFGFVHFNQISLHLFSYIYGNVWFFGFVHVLVVAVG